MALAATSSCSLTLAPSLGASMVLQRDQPASLWGASSAPGESVWASVDGGDALGPATASSWGGWSVDLGQFEADVNATTGHSLKVWSDGCADGLQLDDVLFGDVLLGLGQSNMQFTVNMLEDAEDYYAAADAHPNVRLFTVGTFGEAAEPQFFLPYAPAQPWTRASAEAVGKGGSEWTYFSAVLYITGQKLNDATGVPVGLISSNWGGTMIEPWMSAAALEACGEARAAEPAPPGVGDDIPTTPSGLYNSMIYPLMQGHRVQSMLWDQGESNAWAADLYKCEQAAMAADFRAGFGNDDAAFGYVQLSPYNSTVPQPPRSTVLADFRAAQATDLDADPKAVMASQLDLGDPASPYGDIHQRAKGPVADRLLAGILNLQYGFDVQATGPTAVKASASAASVEVAFDEDSCGSGLVTQAAACPSGYEDMCAEWEVLDAATGAWVDAGPATVDGCGVSVAADGVAQPAGVRYGYSDWPLATLFNEEGFPANTFAATF